MRVKEIFVFLIFESIVPVKFDSDDFMNFVDLFFSSGISYQINITNTCVKNSMVNTPKFFIGPETQWLELELFVKRVEYLHSYLFFR